MLFSTDSAAIHTSRLTKDWFKRKKNIEVLDYVSRFKPNRKVVGNFVRKSMLYSHDHYTYTYPHRTQRRNKDERHSLLEKYTSHFIWKGCVWEGVGDRTELQHIDTHSIGHNRVSFPFSWTAQPGAWGPSLCGCWFSLQHLFSNWSDLQTHLIPNSFDL